MRVLREIYDFVTGGSRVAPVGLAVAMLAAWLAPVARTEIFATLVIITFAASTFERPT